MGSKSKSQFRSYTVILFKGAKALVFLASSLLISCIGPAPIAEYSISKAALEAARDGGAHQRAPNHIFTAEEKYREAVVAYQAKEYDKARYLFRKSIEFSEKAENVSRLNEFQPGEQ